jgi:hypothetical protein
MDPEPATLLIKLGGVYNLSFVVFHLLFWRLFRWREDLASLTFLNRAIMPVLNLSLTFAFFIFGVLSLVFATEMLASAFGRTFLALIALFWSARAVEQVVFFKLRHWGSWAFLGLFLVGAVIYALPAILAY